MKTRIILLFAMISIFLLVAVMGCEEEARLKAPAEEQSNEQMETRQAGNLAWDYPVKPGTAAWRIFQSNQEKVEACQIPEEILSSLSTEDLAELCLQYPLLYDVFAFDNLNNGLEKLYNDFNGIREFYQRKDASIREYVSLLKWMSKAYLKRLKIPLYFQVCLMRNPSV